MRPRPSLRLLCALLWLSPPLAHAASGDNIVLMDWSCTSPDVVAYLPGGPPVPVDCTVQALHPVALGHVPGADVQISLFSRLPEDAPGFHPNHVIDSRVVYQGGFPDSWGGGAQHLGVQIDVSDSDVYGNPLGSWLTTQMQKGRVLGFRLTLTEPGDAFQFNPPTVVALSDPALGFRFGPLSGEMTYGPATSLIISGAVQAPPALDVPGPCGAQTYRLTPDSSVVLPSQNWALPPLSTGNRCVSIASWGGNGAVLDAHHTVGPIHTAGVLGGLPATAEVSLGAQGVSGTHLILALPAGHTWHDKTAAGQPSPRGRTTLALQGPHGGGSSVDLLRGQLPFGFLHAFGLPFSLRVESLLATSAGVTGIHSGTHYAYAHDYHALDRRKAPGPGLAPRVRSNDIRLAVSVPNEFDDFALTPEGLNVELEFDTVAGKTHFPQGALVSPGAELAIVAGRVDSGHSVDGLSGFLVRQTANCGACANGADADLTHGLNIPGTSVVGPDGSVAAVATLDSNPGWGPYQAGQGHIFRREEAPNTPGIQLWPGYVATGSGGPSDTPVVDSLLGVHELQATDDGLMPGPTHLRDSEAARRGNYAFSGLTLGPYEYADANHQPKTGVGSDLSGTTTAIRLGGHGAEAPCPGGACEFQANAGTKYVLRSDGITGAFNTDDVAAFNGLKVYGFPMDLDRFAFAVNRNRVDTTTWMDGDVSVPYPAGFGIDFNGLAFDCTGALGQGRLAGCASGDPTCDRTLAGWKARFVPQSVEFEPVGAGDVCDAGNHGLRVGKRLDMSALEDDLSLSARWTALGTAEDARLTGRTQHVLDRPAAPATPLHDQGLDVAFEGPLSLEFDPAVGGSIIGQAEMGVPFWDTVHADVRLAQKDELTPAKTLFVHPGTVPNLASLDPGSEAAEEAMTDDDSAIRVHFEWGKTGFEFDFNLAYSGNGGGTGWPTFKGISKTTSLVVMDLDGSVDYLTPGRTSIRFGAGAKFDLGGLLEGGLNIDLKDPLSIAGIDGFLEGLGYDAGFISGTIGLLGPSVRTLTDKFTVPAMERAIEAAIGYALDPFVMNIPGFGGGDVWVRLASLFAAIETLPTRIAVDASIALGEGSETIFGGLNADVHFAAKRLYINLPWLFSLGHCQDAARCEEIESDLNRIRLAIGGVDLMIGQLEGTLNLLDSRVLSLVQGALGTLDVLDGFLGAIEEATFGNETFRLAYHSDASESSLPYLALDGEIGPVIDPLIEALQGFDSPDGVGHVPGDEPVHHCGRKAKADDTIRRGSASLSAELDLIRDAFRWDSDETDFGGSLTIPGGWLAGLRLKIGALRVQLETLQGTLETPSIALRDKLEELRVVVDGVGKTFQWVSDEKECIQSEDDCSSLVEGGDVIDIKAMLNEKMLTFTGDAFAFGSDDENDPAFTARLTATFTLPLMRAVSDFAGAVRVGLPGAESLSIYSDPEAFRAKLIDLLLATPPVEFVLQRFQLSFELVTSALVDLGELALGQIHVWVTDVIASAWAEFQAVLDGAASVMADLSVDLPVFGARLDGHAVVSFDALHRLRVEMDFGRSGGEIGADTKFCAALDIKSWSNAEEGVGCDGEDTSSYLDASISTANVGLAIAGSETTLDWAELGFSLKQDGWNSFPEVVGIFGGLRTSGGFDFKAFRLHDLGLQLGVGELETYVGAKGTATFDQTSLSAAFLAGQTCGTQVLSALDPQVAEFITLPNNKFNGVFVRGSASIPIVDFGCLLRLSASADLGAWILGGPPVTAGGLIGGGGSGRFGCIGSLRGQVTLLGERSGHNTRFRGEGFAVAGAGFDCDRHTWTSISRSRRDKWCGTGDASIQGTYENGEFNFTKPSVSAIH